MLHGTKVQLFTLIMKLSGDAKHSSPDKLSTITQKIPHIQHQMDFEIEGYRTQSSRTGQANQKLKNQ